MFPELFLVALDLLFDGVNLDAGIHIKFADTTWQIEDVLNEGRA